MMTDKEIIDLYKAGGRERAFKEIVDSYSERLYWHVRRFVCSHEDTDDLLQEIFIKIWSALPTFRGDSQLYTWLYRIATNETLNFLNKQKVRAVLRFESMSAKMEEKVDEDPWFNGDRMQRELMKAVQKLPAKQQLVFTMRWLEDLSYEDISEILGTSVGALKASYHFATQKLKDELEKIMNDFKP
ncbi:MAG: RNA polymerase sigma factor [Bacteroidales bacterium]|nr:RNA polymerase sigma factor [Bacteroidales bacterium]